MPFKLYLLELCSGTRWKEKLLEKESSRAEEVSATQTNFLTTGMRLRSQTKEILHRESSASEGVLLSLGVNDLLKDVWSGKWVLLSTSSLIAAIWTIQPAFKGFRQHDAHEFLHFLLERTNEETFGAGRSIDGTKNSTSQPLLSSTRRRMHSGSCAVLQKKFSSATETVVTCV
uniref:USP domain-containing protein n=1 Tax=Picocystis salinarum TaxID=88271 RepID=A0A7S3XBA7_9CHLO|mmetsp:Transcript_6854/g.41799  ORF Transcript_6854/g.41799 Transcript_6854/m.41799 type:complete len:173 (+) Transcript_6854:954-1472(+)